VGLIGGSIGMSLRASGMAKRLVGIGRDQKALNLACDLGAIDEGTTDLARGVAEAEVVAICTPVTRIAHDVIEAAKSAPKRVLITDAGSTKRTIVEAVEADSRARATFVGGHPIAGSERKGVSYAQSDLFHGKICVLTPTDQTPPDRLERAHGFWKALGCVTTDLDPLAHDEALALTSHLPHVISAALASTVPPPLLPVAGGAYRDGTRVAGSDPALWVGILCENRAAVLRALEQFESELQICRKALEADDDTALTKWWNEAKERRAAFEDGRHKIADLRFEI
jgi:prephenate dehydrogenase